MRILILEDDPFIALDLQAILEDKGHEIIGIYSSLDEARDHLEDGFDYALLDVDVVGGKSFGIAAELLERHVPFAFVSASHPKDVPPSLGWASFIPKPFEALAILRSVEEVAPDPAICS
ncbi:response regulator [Microvirga sp. 2TAF3]|uniref:response regulator n=1 Tax=Microvirga sp. 2TAF3 TaxID=3233014 RepID=UPI003F975EDE